MKNFCKKYLGILAFIGAVIVCVAFLMYTVSLVAEYSSDVNVQAMERAEFYAKEQSAEVAHQLNGLRNEAAALAERLSHCTDEEAVLQTLDAVLSDARRDADLLDVLYVKDGQLYDRNGSVRTDHPELTALSDGTEPRLSKLFQYNNRSMAIAAAARTDGALTDGVVAVFDKHRLSLSQMAGGGEAEQDELFGKSEFVLLCKHDGKIVDRRIASDTFSIDNRAVQEGILRTLLPDSENFDRADRALTGDTVETVPFSLGSEQYILSISPIETAESGLALLSVYRVSNLYGVGFTMMQNIMAALVGLALIMAILIGMMIVHRLSERRKRYELEMVDQVLHCQTAKKFAKRADELLHMHSNSKFAFVSLTVNNFSYVTEHFGDNAGKQLLRFTADSVHGMLLIEETFGYAGDGEFLLLLQYRDRRSFSERLNGLYLRLSSFNEWEDEDYKVSVAFAVYEVEREAGQEVKSALDKLKIAKEASVLQSAYFSIGFYEDMMHKNYIKRAEIEGRMEQALQNSEFHLFYQPKYNLKANNMDGCEILIRWYDAELERYRTPSEFLPVFEENLFIVKLDHFVFFKACENIAKTVESKQICYPVSVNVSRVTASRHDFVDYYVRIKQKFQIKDDFITLEFTESFAYENYEFLSDIVEKLHQNGFLCSIDDFGTGYSSYNILKTIEMDEIKLDKFFLERGPSAERDQLLLKSVVEMVKKLGMKVTQEGVETKEDLYRLEELGCDVIQGYYFAKPMKYSDYCEFVKKNFT